MLSGKMFQVSAPKAEGGQPAAENIESDEATLNAMLTPVPENAPARVYLNEYRAPAYLVPSLNLHFEINEASTLVRATLNIVRNSDTPDGAPLVLDGEKLKLYEIKLNGCVLAQDEYEVTPAKLTVHNVPAQCTLEITTEIDPAGNKSAEGLYMSGKTLTTQMEAEGFRHVTYFPDRPDVMSEYTTTIVADKAKYPVLLSNGNLVAERTLPDGRLQRTFHDPFPKPCYLFALVGGDLEVLQDTFTTMSGKEVALNIFVEPGKEARTQHAMDSLKRAMRWDEERFGLEYDLNVFNIVAVDSFNAGAMENKSLNIFNSVYILADPGTATDRDFLGIEGVIGHEYFHNWTGDRVTCREWFQLCLKEGLTVYRDQEFSADMNSRPLQRIEDVRSLREGQFPEDAGPNAHSVQPHSYIEINNFYTSTVYDKGAEIYRMLATLIGREAFRAGMKKYFELNDGTAATVEDFLHAMSIASGRDLAQFSRWYEQAGTPVLKIEGRYDAHNKVYELAVEQSCPVTPGQDEKKPFHIPLSVGLIGPDGKDLALRLEWEKTSSAGTTKVLEVTEGRQVFRFVDVPQEPLPSLLRNFSAPVRLEFNYSKEDLLFLFANDSDPFNRYDAGQRLAKEALQGLMRDIRLGQKPQLDQRVIEGFGALLNDESLDYAFRAEALNLPSVTLMGELDEPIDYETAHRAREYFRRAFAENFREDLMSRYRGLHGETSAEYKLNPEAIGKRSLKNTCLRFLAALQDGAVNQMCFEQALNAANMTDEFAALTTLCASPCAETENALALFYDRWKEHTNLVDKWFALQAGNPEGDTLAEVKRLESHPGFDRELPNRLRALYFSFARNVTKFHDLSGDGYRFIVDKILEIDRYNPHISANMTKFFDRYPKLDPQCREKMRAELERLVNCKEISKGVFEIASNILASVNSGA